MRENAFMHIPGGSGIVWDSGQVAYYPLKPHTYLFSCSGGLFIGQAGQDLFPGVYHNVGKPFSFNLLLLFCCP